VWVTLVANSSGLMLSIRDNGEGMQMEAPASTYGLLSMHERALQLDGQLDIQSAPSHGTSLVLTLPLHGEAQQQSH
jgi:signal transduction histidine kinase